MVGCDQQRPTRDRTTSTGEPVTEVDKLPTERLRAGAKTINDAAKLGQQLDERAQETEKEGTE